MPGGPGQLPTRGSHRSGRARLTHPAPQSTGSLCDGILTPSRTRCSRPILASVAIFFRFVEMTSRSGDRDIFPSGSSVRLTSCCPFPPRGPLGSSSPASPVLWAGSDVSSPRLASLPSLWRFHPRACSVRSRVASALRSSGRGFFFCGALEPQLLRMESTRPPRFLGNPCCTCPALRPRRTSCPSPRRDTRYRLPRKGLRRLRIHESFEAQSHGLHASCVRFAAVVAHGPRNTRFRWVASPCRAGFSPAGFL